MATRKISDLTLLGAGEVSSSDTLLLLDNSDPTDQNKRSAVGSIFTAVPSGTYTLPGVRFEGKTSTGVFSETQGQVGLAMGNARLNLQKVGTTLKETQTLENKTLVSASFCGTLSIESFTSSGNATIGSDAADSLTVNAGSTFASAVTFANTVVAQQGVTSNGAISAPSLSLTDDGTTGGGNTILKIRTDDGSPWALVIGNDTYASSPSTGTGFYVSNTGDHNVWFRNNQEFKSVFFKQDDTQGNEKTAIEFTPTHEVKLYHNAAERLSTTATRITIGGAIDAVTSITGSGDITIATDKFTLASATGDAVFGGNITGGGDLNATTGPTFQLGSSNSAKLGIGRAASTYNLEVEGSIYSTGSTIIAGNGSAGKFILQKGAAAISMNFTNSVGTDEVIIDASGRFGVGKIPSKTMDVSGDAGFDGDITVVTTNPTLNTGGKISARELVLTDPSTGATTTLNAISGGGGLSRGKVYFLSN